MGEWWRALEHAPFEHEAVCPAARLTGCERRHERRPQGVPMPSSSGPTGGQP